MKEEIFLNKTLFTKCTIIIWYDIYTIYKSNTLMAWPYKYSQLAVSCCLFYYDRGRKVGMKINRLEQLLLVVYKQRKKNTGKSKPQQSI